MAHPSAIAGMRPYEELLAGLDACGRLRQLALSAGHDFTSNDFLGLAESAELKAAIQEALDRGVPAGAGGSRLLRGNHPEHVALEEEAAAFFGAESALYFSSGFAANYALFAACRSAAISWSTTRSSTPALMTACARAGRSLRGRA